MIKIIYGVAIIIGYASTAHAIRCYSCNSVQVKDCADPFKGGSNYESDCSTFSNFSPGPSGCLKVKLENADGVEVSIRSCYFGELKDAEKNCENSKMIMKEAQISCSVCNGDLCNSSTTTGAFAAIVMLLAVLVHMMS